MTLPRIDKPFTAVENARAFFDRNPDEILTRDDIALKFNCCKRTADNVARTLIREGVPRAQLPRAVKPSRAVQRAAGFPANLTPAEVRAIYAMHRYGSVEAAAAAYEMSANTIASQLRDARRKAGVHKTSVLVELFMTADAQEGEAP